jgi:hypothetical protein
MRPHVKPIALAVLALTVLFPIHAVAQPRPSTDSSGATVRKSYTPNVGSPEWHRQEAKNKRAEDRLRKAIYSICNGCGIRAPANR